MTDKNLTWDLEYKLVETSDQLDRVFMINKAFDAVREEIKNNLYSEADAKILEAINKIRLSEHKSREELHDAYEAGWGDGYKAEHIESDWIDEGFLNYKKENNLQEGFSQEDAEEMASMIDDAYIAVELFGYKNKGISPTNEKWVKEWLEKARKYGATSE